MALGLFANDPFPGEPPKYIRAVLYRYSFAKGGNAKGVFWNRQRIGDTWLPAMSVDDPQLIKSLKAEGWVAETKAN